MADDRRTEIGPDTLVSGEIEAREDIVILGRVEGTVTSTHTVTIEEGGFVQARVQASRIVIAGALVGQAEASERVEITETGRVLGTIATPRLVLLEGGAVQGDIVMDGSSVPAPQASTAPVRVPGHRSSTSTVTSTRRAPTATTTRTGRETARPVVSRANPTRAASVRAPVRPVATEPIVEPRDIEDTSDDE